MEDQIDRRWRKSSYSGNGGSDCVEVGGSARRVLVRDTKDRTGPMLRFTPAAWRGFAGQLKQSLPTWSRKLNQPLVDSSAMAPWILSLPGGRKRSRGKLEPCLPQASGPFGPSLT
jgi:Domain of unknown function (DUF397)